MTIFHDNQLEDTQMASFHRQSKSIPRWARSKFQSFERFPHSLLRLVLESQLQLAFINQVYFNEKSPEDIFGPIHIDLVHQIVQSIDCQPIEPSFLYSSSLLPPNFV